MRHLIITAIILILGLFFLLLCDCTDVMAYDDDEAADRYISCMRDKALQQKDGIISAQGLMMLCHDEARAWMHYGCEAYGLSAHSCGLHAYVFAQRNLEAMEQHGLVAGLPH